MGVGSLRPVGNTLFRGWDPHVHGCESVRDMDKPQFTYPFTIEYFGFVFFFPFVVVVVAITVL